MDEYKRVAAVFAEILQLITDKYVMRDLPIPAEVLTFKDEACVLTAKAAKERDCQTLIGYERRLLEIRENLT